MSVTPAGIVGFLTPILSLVASLANAEEQAPSRASRSLRVAAVSVVQIHREVEGNLKRIEAWARKAADADAELVLFPEAAISGWWQSREIRKYGEPVDGPSIQRLIGLAKELDIAMVVGMTEVDGDKAYLTQVFLDGNGIIGKHRKSALAGGPDNGEQLTWDKGNDANVFNYKDIQIGIAICFECVHPETCRKLKANGAEIILAPHANGTKPSDLLNIEQGRENGKRVYLFDRARENRVWLVGCDDAPTNKDGSKEAGAAYVISPTARLVKLSDPNDAGENMIVHTIELGQRAGKS
jgi:predicted amidohydrolase